jgi:hypothetical protein
MLGRENLRCSFRSRQYLQVQPFAFVQTIMTHLSHGSRPRSGDDLSGTSAGSEFLLLLATWLALRRAARQRRRQSEMVTPIGSLASEAGERLPGSFTKYFPSHALGKAPGADCFTERRTGRPLSVN